MAQPFIGEDEFGHVVAKLGEANGKMGHRLRPVGKIPAPVAGPMAVEAGTPFLARLGFGDRAENKIHVDGAQRILKAPGWGG